MSVRTSSRRRLWRWIAALGAVAAIAVVASGMAVRTYLKSEAFRQLVEREAGEALHGTVELDPLTWQDTTALARRVVVIGADGAGFRSLEASDLRAQVRLGALWDRAWHVPRIEAAGATIDVSPPPAAARPPELPFPSNKAAAAAPTRRPHWFGAILPNRLEVEEVHFPGASLRYAKDGTTFQIEGATMRLRPHGKMVDLDLQGGRGVWNGKRPFVLDAVTARIVEGTVFLTNAQGHTASGGTSFHVTGEAGRRIDLRVLFENMGAAELLSEDWRKRLHGKMRGELSITETGAAGVVELREGSLELLPVLESLARHTRNEDFRRLAITRARARFRRTPERLEVREFSLEGPALRLTGHGHVDHNWIDGVLEVGIAPGTLRWVPGAESRVFQRQEDGFLWTSMRIAGPVESPNEDLSPRLVDAAVAQTIEEAPRKVMDAAGGAVDSAREVGRRVLNAGEHALDRGAGLLRDFVPFFK